MIAQAIATQFHQELSLMLWIQLAARCLIQLKVRQCHYTRITCTLTPGHLFDMQISNLIRIQKNSGYFTAHNIMVHTGKDSTDLINE